jgi:UDP-GlcNAc:undecaprenyl-phosphate GlcNAc-1-phosphate transferase
MLYLGALIAAFLLSAVITFLITPLFEKWGLVDQPDGKRKQHKTATALGGGLGIIIAALVIGAIVQFYTGSFTAGLITQTHLWGILTASLIILIYGLIDDKKAVSPKVAILGPLAVAIIAVISGIEVTKITNPLGGFIEISALISGVVVFCWLMVSMYSIKVADGSDGLVASIGVSSALVIAGLALSDAYLQPDVALMALITAGAIGGFLVFNWPKASIFLGESGSVWIGFAIGVLAIISGSKLLTALIALALPVADLAFVMMRRILMRQSIWQGDRLHLHHLLKDRGWRPVSIILLYISISFGLGIVSLMLEGWQKILVFVLVACLLFFRFVLGWYAEQKKI